MHSRPRAFRGPGGGGCFAGLRRAARMRRAMRHGRAEGSGCLRHVYIYIHIHICMYDIDIHAYMHIYIYMYMDMADMAVHILLVA